VESVFNPGPGDLERLPRLVSQWEEPSPAAHDLFVRPGAGDIGIEAEEDVEVIVQHGESADGDGEDPGQLLEPILNPWLAVAGALSEKQGAPNATGDAVIPPCESRIHQLSTSDGPGRNSWVDPRN
jgi:hypothetical protein